MQQVFFILLDNKLLKDSRKQKYYQNKKKKQLSKTPKHFTSSTNINWLSGVYQVPNRPGREKKIMNLPGCFGYILLVSFFH